MIRYTVTRRDRLAYRLAGIALKLATPAYRRFVTLACQRGVIDLYANPPQPGEALHNDGRVDRKETGGDLDG